MANVTEKDRQRAHSLLLCVAGDGRVFCTVKDGSKEFGKFVMNHTPGCPAYYREKVATALAEQRERDIDAMTAKLRDFDHVGEATIEFAADAIREGG